MNRRRLRTQALMQATARRRMYEQADNAIEQAKFNRLVRAGLIVQDKKEHSLVQTGGGGRGRCLWAQIRY